MTDKQEKFTKLKDVEEEPKVTGVVYKCSHLNVRKTPTLKGDVLIVIKEGSEVEVLRELDTPWMKVSIGSLTGFVMTKFIEVR